MSKSMPQFRPRVRLYIVLSAIALLALASALVVYAAISLSTSTAYTQNFDGMGTPATATTASSLPTDFKVDALAAVRTVGTYTAAGTTTARAGGANLSTTAANGIYNFGAGTTTLGGSDRAVGFLASGTATTSGNLYAQLANNTGGDLSGLQISYNVEKYRHGLNLAGFRIQMFYSTDGSTWTNAGNNFLSSFGADADNSGFATVPGATLAVTSQALTANIPNGTNFYLAWNYSVSSGSTVTNAQALAIDDISILGIAASLTPTNPTGSGSSGTVQAGNSTLLTVTVTPGANPSSTGLAVTANLSSIGGSAGQTLFDNQTNGDATAGDNIFSYQLAVSSGTTPGTYTFPATITDAQSRTGSATVSLTVTPSSSSPTGTGAANPSSLQAGNTTLLTVNVTPGTAPASTGLSVTGDLTLIGGSGPQQFFDDGTHGDLTIGDNIFSFQATVANGTTVGAKSLPISISDAQSRTGSTSISLTVQPTLPPQGSVVISQLYGAGGNSGSTFKSDFIEIFNRSHSPVDLTGWSVQYASQAGTSWSVTTLTNVTLEPGQYYLVQENSGGGGTVNLPTPDKTGTINMSGTDGKVALVGSTSALSGTDCTVWKSNSMDFVGYGGATCFEGAAAAPALTTTSSGSRANNGCTDSNNNNSDFSTGPGNPRNTASALNECIDTVVPSCPSPLNTVVGNATSTTVSASDDDGTVTSAVMTSAAVPGITLDNFIPAPGVGGTATATLNVANTTAIGTYNVTILYSNNDSPTPQTASCTTVVNVYPQPAPYSNAIKISQVYGGGGNSGSTYTNDFIELYNTSSIPVDISGWSVQYTGVTAAFAAQTVGPPPTPLTTVMPAGSIVQPGHYFLIQESHGANGTTSNPTPDVTGGILVGSTAGKIALVASANVLAGGTAGNCPTDPLIVDFIGYGAASCSESSPTILLTNTTAAIRKNNGCLDTDNNSNDFLIDGPIPRNSSSPAHGCGGDPTQISGVGLATPDSVMPGTNTLLTVQVFPATFPASTGITVTGDLTSVGGSASEQFYDDGTHGDQVAGDHVFSVTGVMGAFLTTGAKTIVTTITDAQSHSAIEGITLTIQSPTCGVERWSVKTGTDPDASQVDLNPVPTTIDTLRNLTPPSSPPDNARFGTAERTVYVINATMTLYKLEDDVDYHIVLQDANGHTIVTEIPCPCCVGLSSPFAAGVAHARAQFDARFTASQFFQPASIPVRVTGVGFFDFLHGQTGVAPNGIELHPILDITFLDQTSTALTSSANPSQYGQSVQLTATVTSTGPNTPSGNVTFSDGASVIASSPLNGSGQASFTTTSLSVGSHSITASYPGDSDTLPSTSTVLTQVVNKADQLITFGPLAGKTYGDPDFNVSATASSGLPVSFSIASGPATISGNTVHITGAGTVTVRASQGGDGNYNPAPDVDQSFGVAKATPAITWNNPADIVYGTLLSATQLNATANIPGSFNYTPAAGALLNAGNGQTLTVTFNPSDAANYNSANKSVQINVLKATPSFSSLSSPTIGCTAASTNLSGQISFGPYVPTGVVAITLNSVTQNAAIALDGTFTSTFTTGSLTPANSPLTITYVYGGDGNFNPAIGGGTLTVVDAVPPTITLNGNSISFWPPNHSYHTVTVSDLVASASDGCDANVNLNSVVISQVSSDEGTASSGDIVIAADCKSLQLRGDRDGGGDGRVYTITFRVTDVNHNSTTTTARVTVPHDNGHPNAIDSGAAYTIFGSCP